MTRDECYELLKAAHKRTNWNDLESIKKYNTYAHKLRKQIREDQK